MGIQVKAIFTIYRVVLFFSTENLRPAVAIVKIYQPWWAISFYLILFLRQSLLMKFAVGFWKPYIVKIIVHKRFASLVKVEYRDGANK